MTSHPIVFVGDDAGVVAGLGYVSSKSGAGWRLQPFGDSSAKTDARITGLVLLEPDGTRVASLSRDNTGQVWETRVSTDESLPPQGRPARPIRGHGNWIVDGAVLARTGTDHSSLLLTASSDGTVRIWDPRENPEVERRGARTLQRGKRPELASPVVSVGFAGGKAGRLIEMGRDGIAYVRQIAGDPAPATLAEGYRLFRSATIASLPKNRLATVSFDGQLIVWDGTTGAAISQKPLGGSTGLLMSSGSTGRLLVGTLDPKTGAADRAQILDVEKLVSNDESAAQLSDSRVGGVHPAIQQADRADVGAFSPSGALAVVGTSNGFLQLCGAAEVRPAVRAHPTFEITEDSSADEKGTPIGVTGVVFLSESRLMSSGLDGRLRFWNVTVDGLKLEPGELTLGDQKLVLGLIASADGKRAAVQVRHLPRRGQATGIPVYSQIRVLELSDAQPRWTGELLPYDPASKTPPVSGVDLSPDGRRLLITVAGGALEWSIGENGAVADQPAPAFPAHRGFPVAEARYVMDSTTGRWDEIALLGGPLVTLWKRTEGSLEYSELDQSLGLPVASQACDLSADGALAVTGAGGFDPTRKGLAQIEGEVRVWNVASRKRIAALRTDSLVTAVAFDPMSASSILVARDAGPGSDESIVALYDLVENNPDLQLRLEVGRLKGRIRRARFAHNGAKIVVAGEGGEVRVYGLDRDQASPQLKISNAEVCFKRDGLGQLESIDMVENGDLLAVASRRQVLVFDLGGAGDGPSAVLQGHSGDLTDVRFAPGQVEDLDGQNRSQARLWTSGLDGTAKLWSLTRQASVAGTIQGSDQSVIAHSAVYDARPLLNLRGHRGGILALSVAENGDLITGGQDGRVIYWPTRPVDQNLPLEPTSGIPGSILNLVVR